MEYSFELCLTPNYKMTVEDLRKYGIGPKIPTAIVTWILLISLFVISYTKGMLVKYWEIETVLAVVLLVAFFTPHYLTWFSFAKLKKKNDGRLPEAIVRFADSITCQIGEGIFAFDYADLVGVIHMRHSYKLQFTNRRGLLLDTDAFTKGTFSEFKKFIRQKRPDLVIPE